MKKIFKAVLLLFLISALLFSVFFIDVVYRRFAFENWNPCIQKNTKWASEDDSIVFTVGDAGATGKMSVDDSEIEFYMITDMGGTIELHPIEVSETKAIYYEKRYEFWECSYKSKNKFVATVKETTFLKEGEKITFNKVSDNT